MTYRIIDEPAPGGLSRYAVSPDMPLLGVILFGSVVTWPWLAFNSFAIGSASKDKECWLCAVGAFGGFALAFGLVTLAEHLPVWVHPYLALVYLAWKLGFTYPIYFLQSRSFELYEFHGGCVVRNRVAFLFALFVYVAIRVAIPYSELPDWVALGLK